MVFLLLAYLDVKDFLCNNFIIVLNWSKWTRFFWCSKQTCTNNFTARMNGPSHPAVTISMPPKKYNQFELVWQNGKLTWSFGCRAYYFQILQVERFVVFFFCFSILEASWRNERVECGYEAITKLDTIKSVIYTFSFSFSFV